MRRLLPVLTVFSVVALVGGTASYAVNADSTSQGTARIIGGQTSTRDLPWIVYLDGCGGALVAPQWVMTAAHCLDSGGFPTQVRVGSLDKEKGGTVANVIGWFPHPNFSWATPHTEPKWDFGLVKLEKPLPNATIPMSSVKPATGSQATVLGWGSTNTDLNAKPSPFPRILKELTSTVREAAACTSKDIPGVFTPEREICLSNVAGTEGTCNGDSGSPLIAQRNGVTTLIGVVNRGGLVCGKTPGIYADVAAYTQWTADVMAKN